MKKILIVDDHPVIRKGIRLILSAEFPHAEFSEAPDGIKAYKLLSEQRWDLITLDVDMPGRNGLELLKQIRDEDNKTPVLIFSLHPEEQVATRALKLGASGYLSKDTADQELVKAVRCLLEGRKYISSSLAEILANQIMNPDDRALHEQLSDREFQTMLLIAKGRSTTDIAAELNLSASTVSTYRTRILEKMRLRSNAEVTRYAIENKLI